MNAFESLLTKGFSITIGKPKPLRACDARSESLKASGYLIAEKVKHQASRISPL